MNIMHCTEDGKDSPKIHLSLNSGTSTGGPDLILSLPDECWPNIGKYDGCNVYYLTLEDLLKETLADHIDHDHGQNTHLITSLLREYADKLEADLK